jgi:DNA-binding NtrC family response regulator
VVSSRALREIFETAERLARARLPVLLVGETGTGKEVVARAIHERGPRANGPMVCVNCGAIPRDLVESTLFGHVKGAFTGASEASRGVFGAADGGTVLLDEVGELPAAAQAALLRALEHGRVHPVGASEETEVDVRVVAATHRDLEAMCEEGSFRGDLFYRLDAFRLLVPPLRERPEDIVPLARHFLAQACARGDAAIASIAPDALEALGRHDWPGNVRELRNAIERAAVIARAGCITADDLPERVRAAAGFAGPVAGEPRASADEASNEDGQLLSGEGDLRARVGRYEARVIAAAIHAAGGNQTEAARLLGVPVRTLSDKIRRLGVPLERRRG